MFKFKQFSVDQTGCAMKINTDGVLLGAMAQANNPATILDIGTGTGVIALMMAQCFTAAQIDAVEVDEAAALTASRNFEFSPFIGRLTIYPTSFENYFSEHPARKYDLILSNPPFYIDSLKSPGVKKTLAKHTDVDFFERLINVVSGHLTPNGVCWLIIPLTIAEMVSKTAIRLAIHQQKIIEVLSYAHSEPHRVIFCLGRAKVPAEKEKFVIYKTKDIYTDEYKAVLKPYFLAF